MLKAEADAGGTRSGVAGHVVAVALRGAGRGQDDAVGLALGAAQFAPDRLGLQHLDARLERADCIGQFAGRDVAQPAWLRGPAFRSLARKDYMVGANLSGSGVDDPDAYFFEHYACGSERNYTNYCNPELEKMYEQQSIEPDQTKRKQLVWEIDRRLQEDAARPMIFNYRLGTCRSRAVHGITIMVNSLFNGWRFEDAWLGQ
jgi:hypothetical protein